MIARIRNFARFISETFWVVPALMVALGIVAGVVLVNLDRDGVVPKAWIDSPWLYSGGGTGARTLLGAVASSTIGVAGTVFSITIAALSLAAGQMGPRLLRNFTKDRGNQFTLGAFLGTFSYALMVLRSVRTDDHVDFVPHLALSIAIALAFLCVGTLVYFVGHMAGRVNVDIVIGLVSDDVRRAIDRQTVAAIQSRPPSADFWANAEAIVDRRRGYLQHLHAESLADWAAERDVVIRLLVRPGDYVFPSAAIALVVPSTRKNGDARSASVDGAVRNAAASAIVDATVVGRLPSSGDIEYAVRQLVEVAVRALSPGINDPHTAMSCLAHLGSALCDVSGRHLPTGVHVRDGRAALLVPAIAYDGLCDEMFDMIRQNAAGSAAVLMRELDVLTAVASCERIPTRLETLAHHARLVCVDAERDIANEEDRADVLGRFAIFEAVVRDGPLGYLAMPERMSVVAT